MSQPKTLHLVGVGVMHSPAPPMHDYIARTLGLPWTFTNVECPTLEDVRDLARSPSVAGLVVTMPYKHAVMSGSGSGSESRGAVVVDSLDARATLVGACNHIAARDCLAEEGGDGTGRRRLVGGNTDWAGIKGSLLEAADADADAAAAAPEEASRHGSKLGSGTTTSPPPPALLVGAGGASRAAVYALSAHMGCSTIYVLNRCEDEIQDLVRDVQRMEPVPSIYRVKSLEQATDLESPYYVVSCVPDILPESEAEHMVFQILKHFLSRPTKGVLLDMCYKPRRTRIIKQAEELGWRTVDGTHVIGHQAEEQWKLWVGPEKAARINKQVAWDILMREVDGSSAINF
jgi:quinate dehydrogenase